MDNTGEKLAGSFRVGYPNASWPYQNIPLGITETKTLLVFNNINHLRNSQAINPVIYNFIFILLTLRNHSTSVLLITCRYIRVNLEGALIYKPIFISTGILVITARANTTAGFCKRLQIGYHSPPIEKGGGFATSSKINDVGNVCCQSDLPICSGPILSVDVATLQTDG